MKNKNYTRVLSEQQIKDITEQMAADLIKYPKESAEYLMNFYLNGDEEGLFNLISDWVEAAEHDVIQRYNTELMEESFNSGDDE